MTNNNLEKAKEIINKIKYLSEISQISDFISSREERIKQELEIYKLLEQHNIEEFFFEPFENFKFDLKDNYCFAKCPNNTYFLEKNKKGNWEITATTYL